jgi:hypothetical protein
MGSSFPLESATTKLLKVRREVWSNQTGNNASVPCSAGILGTFAPCVLFGQNAMTVIDWDDKIVGAPTAKVRLWSIMLYLVKGKTPSICLSRFRSQSADCASWKSRLPLSFSLRLPIAPGLGVRSPRNTPTLVDCLSADLVCLVFLDPTVGWIKHGNLVRRLF